MKKMALIAFTDYKKWPMGGIINYIKSILSNLDMRYDIDLWVCSVNGEQPEAMEVNQERKRIRTYCNVVTGRKSVPNILKGAVCMPGKGRRLYATEYDVMCFHTTC